VVAVLVAAALDGGFEFYDIWSTMGTSTIKQYIPPWKQRA